MTKNGQKGLKKSLLYSGGMQKEGLLMPRKAKNDVKSLQEQAEEIKRQAKAKGLETNFFFTTTFDRYLSQLAILEDLKQTIDNNQSLVEQTYVKGRSNVVLNPAIRAFNSTTDSANKTVATLIRIIRDFGDEDEDSIEDPLVKIINGGK